METPDWETLDLALAIAINRRHDFAATYSSSYHFSCDDKGRIVLYDHFKSRNIVSNSILCLLLMLLCFFQTLLSMS